MTLPVNDCKMIESGRRFGELRALALIKTNDFLISIYNRSAESVRMHFTRLALSPINYQVRCPFTNLPTKVGDMAKSVSSPKPLTTLPVDHAPVCTGHRWQIRDEDKLAELVAHIVLGQYRGAKAILKALDPMHAKVTDGARIQAIASLTLPPGTPLDATARWHRDGLVFQHISWVAAITESQGLIAISPPHARPANKGFDGLYVHLTPTGDAEDMLVICEDKATVNARSVITSKVWPEITSIEKGERDAELTSELTSLLEQNNVPNFDAVLERGLWAKKKHYRVAITIKPEDDEDEARKSIFKGYDKVAPHTASARRASTMALDNLRNWMDTFCTKVIGHIKTIGVSASV